MLGGMLFHFFPVDTPEQQASTIDILASGTTEGQYAFSVSPNIFFGDGLYRFNAMVFVNFWKANFYAIGNESPDVSEEYESTNLGGSLNIERWFFDSFTLDLIGRYENANMDVEAGGILATGTILGSDDGEYIGLGLAGGYDTRDNTNAPDEGILARYEYISYDENLGSALDFHIKTWDLRYYQFQRSVLNKNSNLEMV